MRSSCVSTTAKEMRGAMSDELCYGVTKSPSYVIPDYVDLTANLHFTSLNRTCIVVVESIGAYLIPCPLLGLGFTVEYTIFHLFTRYRPGLSSYSSRGQVHPSIRVNSSTEGLSDTCSVLFGSLPCASHIVATRNLSLLIGTLPGQ